MRFGIGADHRLLHHLLAHHDHAVGGERGLLLAAQQPPDLRVAAGVGTLRVHDRDVGLQRRDHVDLGRVLVRRDHGADVRVHLRDVGLVVAADREERQVRRAGHVPADHAEVRVLLDLERRGVGVLDPPPDRVERADAGVAQPREHELGRDAGADHLVVDHVGRQTAERQVAPALPDDLVSRREADQVREALDRHGVAVLHQRLDGVVHRRDLVRAHPTIRPRGRATRRTRCPRDRPSRSRSCRPRPPG